MTDAPARAAEPHCARCGGAHPPLVMPDVRHAVYVMPEPAQVELRAREWRMACGCVSRFALVEACAAVAERIECEALGSPIAQDTARRIRLAILALREERR